MPKLLLVDGSNLLFQMFYGMPARIINHQGKAIQGTLGFVGALRKILQMTDPTHVAVLFDGEAENPRSALSAEYKANREDYSQMPEEDIPFSQLPDIYAALDCMGICHRETTHCETDDWIASYARTLGAETQIVICSQDSDYFQLICPNVSVLRYRGKQSVLCDDTYIREKLGIEPSQYADFKSLTGDTADNIKGCHGIGPKTAAALLRQYGTLENLLQNADTIAKPALREAVMQSRDRLRVNHQLIYLSGNEPLPFSLLQLAHTPCPFTTHQILTEIGLRS